MRGLLLLVLVLAACGGAQAQETRGSSGFCLAADDQANAYYWRSSTPTPASRRTREYQKKLKDLGAPR